MNAVRAGLPAGRHTGRLAPPVAGPGPGRGRRRAQAAPYLLALPTLLVLGALLAFPLLRMVVLSFQHLSLRDLFTGEAPAWVGLANYQKVLSSGEFWTMIARTGVVAAICVVLSVLAGLAVALLMRRVSGWVRILMVVAMMLVWAMPQMVATQVFHWLVDTDWGVVNWVLNKLPGVDYSNHSWWINPVQGWSVIIALVIWGAIPFLAVNLYAALSQVPRELIEAAEVDGAGPWEVFRSIMLPAIRPLLMIVTTLSVIWDIGMFTQPFIIRLGQPEPQYQTLAVYSYVQAFGQHDYSLGSAISVLAVLLTLGVTVFYIRQMFQIGDAD